MSSVTDGRFARLVTQRGRSAWSRLRPIDGAGLLPSQEFWVHTFSLTYATELRSERSTRYLALYEANARVF